MGDDLEDAPEDRDGLVVGIGPSLEEGKDKDTIFILVLQLFESDMLYKRIGIRFISLEKGAEFVEALGSKQRIYLV